MAELTREAVEKAAAEFDRLGRDQFLTKYGYGRARDFFVVVNGKRYDSKAIAGVAQRYLPGGEVPGPGGHSGGLADAAGSLRVLGFDIVSDTKDIAAIDALTARRDRPARPIEYVVGQTYSRKLVVQPDIGGNAQAGIFYAAGGNKIGILDTKRGLERNGYENGWLDDGRFQYSGQGKRGDQTFTGPNLEVLNHSVNGKQLLLFTQPAKGALIRFEGEMVVEDFVWTKGADRDGKQRKVITFRMRPIEAVQKVQDEDVADLLGKKLSELRRAALTAATIPANAARSSERTVYERSRIVRAYVLARAKGKCEGCEQNAPFMRIDGTPYLEPHHILRVSDGGPDHPSSVIALCPTCHRRVHAGADGRSLNDDFAKRMQTIEPRD